jgi:hypothetical protein
VDVDVPCFEGHGAAHDGRCSLIGYFVPP